MRTHMGCMFESCESTWIIEMRMRSLTMRQSKNVRLGTALDRSTSSVRLGTALGGSSTSRVLAPAFEAASITLMLRSMRRPRSVLRTKRRTSPSTTRTTSMAPMTGRALPSQGLHCPTARW